ncbi:MAG: 50S ribosomal protein L18 [Planctomycetota bacterium]
MALTKVEKRQRRHQRVRKKVVGAAHLPRLSVYRSGRHIYAQVIADDHTIGFKVGHAVVKTIEEAGPLPLPVLCSRTLVQASSVDKELRTQLKHGGNLASATAVGAMVAKRALAAGIQRVVFDRGGFKYHGRIKALAEAARKGGLTF